MSLEITRTLHDLKLPGMARYWDAMAETHQLDKLSFRDGMTMMVQSEIDMRNENRISKLVKNARFRQKAYIEQLEMDTTRGIPSSLVTDLSTGDYIKNGRTVIITGPAGTGKSYLASALGDRACRQGFKVMYFTMNNLVEQLRLVHLEGRQTHFLRKLANQDLLIIDDFGMQKLQGEIQNDVEQIVDDRYKEKSLILASQLPVSDWYRVFQSELIADAFMDRVSHTELRFTLQGDSLRKKY